MLNFLEGRGLAMDVRQWFDQSTPRPRVSPRWIDRIRDARFIQDDVKTERRCVWIGGSPVIESRGRRARLHLANPKEHMAVTLASGQASWLSDVLVHASVRRQCNGIYPSWQDARRAFPGKPAEFAAFVKQPVWRTIRAAGLLLV
jgi:hypothetical protein